MQIKPELQKYLQSKRWHWKPDPNGKDISVKICPFCGKSKWKFSIHGQTTQYRCWHCDAKGNLYGLKRGLGDLNQSSVVVSAASANRSSTKKYKTIDMELIDRWHQKLLGSESGLEYCKARGFDLEVIRKFKLGLRVKQGIKWLAIPHITDGVCRNVKFRSLPPAEKRFDRIRNCESVLFNADALADHNEILICESETDAMSWWGAGIKNVVAVTAGAGSFLPEWYDQVVDKERIILAFDADAVGQNGARDIARRLGFDRCHNVLLPIHDANEMLVAVGRDELKRTLRSAEQFEVEGLLSTGDVLRLCAQQSEIGEVGLMTPWHAVNQLIKPGWQPGDLIILSATPKTGKTSLALNICHEYAVNGIPSLMYCLEMRPTRLAEKLVQMHRKRRSEDLDRLDYVLSRYHMGSLPLYFVDPSWDRGVSKVDAVFDKIREIVRRHGIKFMTFDHLHFLCRSLTNITTEIGHVTRGFKLLAEELHMTIMLIAHPRKTNGRMPTSEDLKDSQSIHADADQVIFLYRKPILDDTTEDGDQTVLDPKTKVRVDAARFGAGGNAWIYFQGETATFVDLEDRPVAQY